MNATTEVNAQLLKLIQNIQQQVGTLARPKTRLILPILQTFVTLQMILILVISIVVTVANIFSCMDLDHIPVWTAIFKRLAKKMQQLFVARLQGVKIIVVLHLNCEVGWKLKKKQIQYGYRYLLKTKNMLRTIFKLLNSHRQPLQSYLKFIVMYTTNIFSSDTLQHYKML